MKLKTTKEIEMLAPVTTEPAPPSVENRRGSLDAAHVAAHTFWEQGNHSLGRRALEAWLSDRHDDGSRWVHVQWHLILFELARGRYDDAYDRFEEHVLPAVAAGDDALTDAPAALWWFRFTVGEAMSLPWSLVRERALASLNDENDPFVELHNLLAIAGAGDGETLARWIAQQGPVTGDGVERTVVDFALGLLAYVMGEYAQAVTNFDAAAPGVARLGGSQAQNELFERLFAEARKLADVGAAETTLRVAYA